MIWAEAIVAYFRALHWQSPEGIEQKNYGGARYCNHFMAVIFDGNFSDRIQVTSVTP
jgi:hypothetical protein